jgi:hypothetical protein
MFPRLRSEETLRLVTVTFSLPVFLVRVLHVDLLVHEELLIHALNRFIRRLERVVRDKPEALGEALIVTRNLF